MFRTMTDADMDNAIILATYQPDALQLITPGMFAERFGVPTDGQWDVLREVLCFDRRARLCAISNRPLPIPRSLSFEHLESR